MQFKSQWIRNLYVHKETGELVLIREHDGKLYIEQRLSAKHIRAFSLLLSYGKEHSFYNLFELVDSWYD